MTGLDLDAIRREWVEPCDACDTYDDPYELCTCPSETASQVVTALLAEVEWLQAELHLAQDHLDGLKEERRELRAVLRGARRKIPGGPQ